MVTQIVTRMDDGNCWAYCIQTPLVGWGISSDTVSQKHQQELAQNAQPERSNDPSTAWMLMDGNGCGQKSSSSGYRYPKPHALLPVNLQVYTGSCHIPQKSVNFQSQPYQFLHESCSRIESRRSLTSFLTFLTRSSTSGS